MCVESYVRDMCVCGVSAHLYSSVNVIHKMDRNKNRTLFMYKFFIEREFHTSQDRLIDLKTKTGLIHNRVHYVKYKKPARQAKKTKTGQSGNNDDDGHDIDTHSDDAIDEVAFLLFFKTCIVERDVDELKKRLEQSIDMRQNLINKKETEFHKVFPFYFVEPSLVSIF